MKKKLLISVSKIGAIIIGSIVVLLSLVLLAIELVFKDEVIAFVKQQINKQTVCTINVSDIKFSLWKTFPGASIEFSDITVFSPLVKGKHAEEGNKLLTADKLYLDFNLIKLLKGQYQLDKVILKNGFVHIVLDSLGNGNYDILRKSDKKDSNDLDFI